MAKLIKGDQAVTYSGHINEGFKKLPNHDGVPKNPQKVRKLKLT